MRDLLCPVDMSELGATALAHAVRLAKASESSVTLLHVRDKHERAGPVGDQVRAELDALVQRTAGGAPVRVIYRDGNFMKEIAAEAAAGHALMVAGTHGPRGLRQNLFGADILKLVRHVGLPSWIMQRDSPAHRVERLVMPVSGHEEIGRLLDTVTWLAKLDGTEVHVYQVMRPNEEPSEQLRTNKRRALHHLEQAGVRTVEVNEPLTVFSVGFAEQTIRYAHSVDAHGFAIIADASDEYRYLADAEKERLLVNEHAIPVLCAH
ncbi:MAG: universal stress protein [Flavobacteriales bacterium]|nr:universal stress protein [Flavobacteriales bacterium]